MWNAVIVRVSLVIVVVVSYYGAASYRSNALQERITLDFDPPTLVVGQMEMQGVEFVVCHKVDMSLDLVDGEKMSGRVKMLSPIRKAGIVCYRAGRKSDFALRRFYFLVLPKGKMSGKQSSFRKLTNRLQSIEKACVFIGLNDYFVFIDVHLVAFVFQSLVRHFHKDDCVFQIFVFDFLFVDYSELCTESRAKTLLQKLGNLHFFALCVDVQNGLLI